MTLEEFAYQSNLPAQECKGVYEKILENDLDPSNFYVIKNENRTIIVAKYTFILNLIVNKVDYYQVDIENHPVMGECAVAKIKRKDFSDVFIWYFPLSSYRTQYELNKYFMVRKACLVQAARLLFPDVFHNYTLTFYDETEIASESSMESNSAKSKKELPTREQVSVATTNKSTDDNLSKIEERVRSKIKEMRSSEQLFDNMAKLLYKKNYNDLDSEKKIEVVKHMLKALENSAQKTNA